MPYTYKGNFQSFGTTRIRARALPLIWRRNEIDGNRNAPTENGNLMFMLWMAIDLQLNRDVQSETKRNRKKSMLELTVLVCDTEGAFSYITFRHHKSLHTHN